MVAPGTVVLVPFPFSDLSQAKLRPAVILADVGRGDYIMCQITSNVYSDPGAVRLVEADFESGSLRIESYARPGKLFTANDRLIIRRVGILRKETLDKLRGVVISLLTK